MYIWVPQIEFLVWRKFTFYKHCQIFMEVYTYVLLACLIYEKVHFTSCHQWHCQFFIFIPIQWHLYYFQRNSFSFLISVFLILSESSFFFLLFCAVFLSKALFLWKGKLKKEEVRRDSGQIWLTDFFTGGRPTQWHFRTPLINFFCQWCYFYSSNFKTVGQKFFFFRFLVVSSFSPWCSCLNLYFR